MIGIHNEEVQVGQVIIDIISLQPLRVNMMNVGKEEEVLIENVVHVDSYHVELEFVDFVFVSDNSELSDKSKLLDVLSKTFNFNTRFNHVCIHHLIIVILKSQHNF